MEFLVYALWVLCGLLYAAYLLRILWRALVRLARRKTGFDRYFQARMKDAQFASDYTNAKAEIDAASPRARSGK